jgi:hypothetical protein
MKYNEDCGGIEFGERFCGNMQISETMNLLCCAKRTMS